MSQPKITTLSIQQLQSMTDRELDKLIASTNKIIKSRIAKIEAAGYGPLVDKSTIPKIKPSTTKTRLQKLNTLKAQRTYLRGDTSSVSSISKALTSAYKRYRNATNAKNITIFNPRDIRVKIVTSKKTGKQRTVYENIKTGKRAYLRVLPSGEEVFVPHGTSGLQTRAGFKKSLKLFQSIRDSHLLSYLPSGVEAVLLWNVKRGNIPGLSTQKNQRIFNAYKLKLIADIAMATTNIASLNQDDAEFIKRVPQRVFDDVVYVSSR